MSCDTCPWLWSTWVKAPILRGSDILIASACLPIVNPELFKRLAEGRTVLLACPERENPTHYGKIASIVRSSKPRSMTVVTIDGSPHCFTLHASINEAEYILGESIPREHYVVVNGREMVKITPNAVRVARYLSVVQEMLSRNPESLKKLESLSLEYVRASAIEEGPSQAVATSKEELIRGEEITQPLSTNHSVRKGGETADSNPGDS